MQETESQGALQVVRNLLQVLIGHFRQPRKLREGFKLWQNVQKYRKTVLVVINVTEAVFNSVKKV